MAIPETDSRLRIHRTIQGLANSRSSVLSEQRYQILRKTHVNSTCKPFLQVDERNPHPLLISVPFFAASTAHRLFPLVEIPVLCDVSLAARQRLEDASLLCWFQFFTIILNPEIRPFCRIFSPCSAHLFQSLYVRGSSRDFPLMTTTSLYRID